MRQRLPAWHPQCIYPVEGEIRMAMQVESNSYRVEVSGWDSSENFFVEKTSLTWTQNGERQITLKCDLREGSVIFARLLQPTTMVNNIPVAYQVKQVAPRDSYGRVRISMIQLRPKAAENRSQAEQSADLRNA
jgi:hypothetical protein